MQAQRVIITLSDGTVQALGDLGYALYGLRGFNVTSAAGRSLVWAATADLALNVAVDFGGEYEAYMSVTQATGGATIVQTTSAPVQLGQTATLGDDNKVVVTPGGRADAVTLVNGTTTPVATGLAVANGGPVPAPVCSTPLYGLGEAIIAPLNQFLLTFNTQGLSPGAQIDQSVSQSLLINITDQTEVTASYDINTGWDAGGAAWAQVVKAGTPLKPLLAHQKPML